MDEMTPAEMGRAVQRIETTLNALAQEVRSDVKEARHLARDALHGIQLQKEVNVRLFEKLNEVTAVLEDVEHLKTNSATQEAVTNYRRWLFGIATGLGGMSLINLVINIQQSPPPNP